MTVPMTSSIASGRTQRLVAPCARRARSCRLQRVPARQVAFAGHERASARCSTVQPESSFLEKAQEFVSSTAVKVIGAVALAALMICSFPGIAEAARSGGRVGGSGFSSARGMGGGSMGGSRSYGGPSRPSYGGTMRSAPPVQSTTIVPSFGFGYSPFGYGYGAPVVVGGGGGSSLFTLLVLGIFAYVAFNAITGSRDDGYDDEDYDQDNAPMSVVKLQVGLMGTARELQRDLNRLGNNIDTSTPQGLHYLLTETMLALRRNPQYAVYGEADLTKTRGLDNAEAKFNMMSNSERSKFERETLSNFGGRTTRSVAKVSGDGANELIVVTVIAAIDGKVQPAEVHDAEGLKENLELLGGVPADRLLALEVLWTPQDENDYFTKDELVTDYPTLNML